MTARFFIAPACYSTWTKVYVLTEDGTLYSEYLDYMRSATDRRQVDFESFNASDYSWSGYQHLRECTREEAIQQPLTRQRNWVLGYLKRIGM